MNHEYTFGTFRKLSEHEIDSIYSVSPNYPQICSVKHSKRSKKYKNNLQSVISLTEDSIKRNIFPISTSGFCSFINSSWLSKWMWEAYKKKVSYNDLWVLSEEDQVKGNAESLLQIWNSEGELTRTVLRFIVKRTILSCIAMLICVLCAFSSPAFIVRYFLEYIQDGVGTKWLGVALVVSYTMCDIIGISTLALSWNICTITGLRLRGALLSLIFRKILKTRNLTEKCIGELITLCTTDVQALFEAVTGGLFILATPITGIATLIYSTLLIGPWALLGFSMFILIYFLQIGISKLTTIYRTRSSALLDERGNIMSDTITNIKLIKMYAWEEYFSNNIKRVRKKELEALQNLNYVQSINTSLTPLVPLLASVVTFIGLTLTGGDLTSSQAFTIVAVFNSASFSLTFLPFAIQALAEGKVSCRRIQSFLKKEEIVAPLTNNKNIALEFNHAFFTWDVTNNNSELNTTNNNPDDQCSTKNIKDVCAIVMDLRINPGTLVGICGYVGSGKSSLLNAVLGEMKLLDGSMYTNGSIAYAPQQAWIFKGTVKENILFGKEYDNLWYKKVIQACCLEADLEAFKNGDNTELSGSGQSLSGGQKQRIGLARAVYSKSDIYLLDDPLSALDAKVAYNVFENCIKNLLKEKTILFVSHNIQFIKKCDYIIYMKNGKIFEEGSHEDLKSKNGFYAEMVFKTAPEEAKSKNIFDQTRVFKDEKTMPLDEQQEILDFETKEISEANEKCNVAMQTYFSYGKYLGGIIMIIVLLFSVILFVGSTAFNSYWLSYWLMQGNGKSFDTTITLSESKNTISGNPDLIFYIIIYGGSFLGAIILCLIKGFLFTKAAFFASKKIHTKAFFSVIRAPISFFDLNDAGKIQNRFSKDIDEVDSRLPNFMETFIQGILTCLSFAVLIIIYFPLFLAVMIPVIIILLLLDYCFNVGVEEAKRFDNVSRSDILNHLTTTVRGLTSIRTFNVEEQSLRKFEASVDKNTVPFGIFSFAIRWYGLRLDWLIVISIGILGIIIIFTHEISNAAKAGLAMSSAIQINMILQVIMKIKSDVQARFTSVQRLNNFITDIIPEASTKLQNAALLTSDWPKNGHLIYQSVNMKYRENTPLVLKEISFEILPNEKIGIIGRTGSGKSSLAVALFRLAELESGNILLDNELISKLPLYDLRTKLSIIPQDPVLFSGTLRNNLDPFDKYSDEEIWNILEKAHLKDRISMEGKQLLTIINGRGENFSMGERQLICLARVLLRQSKIVLMDEATASIDSYTDTLIQDTIRKEFNNCTVLIIAHRLETLLKCDRIMILDQGNIKKIISPDDLSKEEADLQEILKENENEIQTSVSDVDLCKKVNTDSSHLSVVEYESTCKYAYINPVCNLNDEMT